MRIARFRNEARGRPHNGFAVLDGDHLRVLHESPYSGGGIPAETGERLHLADVALLAPVQPSKILAVGRNYVAHVAEMGLSLPSEPSVFMKPPTSLLDPGGTVILPDPALAREVQHEAELALVIGRQARHVPPTLAFEYILGYTCANDVSARDLQRRDSNPIRAKGFDTFCPLGPWVETDLDPSDLAITCTVNGQKRQDGRTSDLIFDVPTLIASLSAWTTLLPGDVILTGSPHGTGSMEPGDRVDITITGIGTLSTLVDKSH